MSVKSWHSGRRTTTNFFQDAKTGCLHSKACHLLSVFKCWSRKETIIHTQRLGIVTPVREKPNNGVEYTVLYYCAVLYFITVQYVPSSAEIHEKHRTTCWQTIIVMKLRLLCLTNPTSRAASIYPIVQRSCSKYSLNLPLRNLLT